MSDVHKLQTKSFILGLATTLVCTLLSGFSAWAHLPQEPQSSLEKLYRERIDQVLIGLENFGVTEMICTKQKCRTPRQIIHLAASVNFREIGAFSKPIGALRWTAFSSDLTNTVYLNLSARHDPRLIGYLGLHEILGALGFPENEYKITRAAFLLLNLREIDPNKRAFLIEQLRHAFEIAPFRDGGPNDPDRELLVPTSGSGGRPGGGTVIGGGGDAEALGLRLELYTLLLKSWKNSLISEQIPLEFIYNDVNIEMRRDILNEVSYVFEDGSNWPKKILVPRLKEWTQPVPYQNEMISPAVLDIAHYFASILYVFEDFFGPILMIFNSRDGVPIPLRAYEDNHPVARSRLVTPMMDLGCYKSICPVVMK